LDPENLEPDSGDLFIELADNRKRKISFEFPKIEELNAIQEELRAFRNCIVNDSQPAVTIQDGLNALQVAHQIVSKLHLSSDLLASNI